MKKFIVLFASVYVSMTLMSCGGMSVEDMYELEISIAQKKLSATEYHRDVARFKKTYAEWDAPTRAKYKRYRSAMFKEEQDYQARRDEAGEMLRSTKRELKGEEQTEDLNTIKFTKRKTLEGAYAARIQ